MNNNLINQSSFLRTSREFPEDLYLLSQEIDRSYLDIANAVNSRIISIYPTNRSAVNGESWYLSGNKRQQGFRQVYTFTNILAGTTTLIAHGLNYASISTFTKITGMGFVTATGRYIVIPYVSATLVTNQIEIFVDSTNINIISGATAPSPLARGFILLEWISNP